MEFVPFSTAAWDDPWVLELSPEQRLLWLYLCTSPNSDYGFLEYSPKIWTLRTGLSIEQIDDALATFKVAGKIHRHDDMILVVRALLHRRLRGKNLDGALRSISTKYASRYPDLVELCCIHNGVVDVYNGVTTTQHNITHHITSYQNTSLTDETGVSTGKTRKKQQRSETATYSEEYLKLAESFIEKIVDGYLVEQREFKVTAPRGAPAIAAAMDKSKIPTQELWEIIRWAAKDTFHASRLVSLGQWTKAATWIDLRNKYKQQNDITQSKAPADPGEGMQ